MAHHGFCSNEKLIKSMQKRYKDKQVFLVSPEMLFLEEFWIFLTESSLLTGLTSEFIIDSGKQKFKKLPMSEKLRYIELSEKINHLILEESFDWRMWSSGWREREHWTLK